MRFDPRSRLVGGIQSQISNWMGGRPIRFQIGTITIGNAQTSSTATITAVDTTSTIIAWLGTFHNSSGITAAQGNIDLVLTNSTTVTGTVNTAEPASSLLTNFLVITAPRSMIKSIQQHLNVTATPATFSPAIDPTYTLFVFSGSQSTSTSTSQANMMGAIAPNLYSSTTAGWDGGGGQSAVYVSMIEFRR